MNVSENAAIENADELGDTNLSGWSEPITGYTYEGTPIGYKIVKYE